MSQRVRELAADSEKERQQAADLLAVAFADAVSIQDLSDVAYDPSLLKHFFLAILDACAISGSVTVCGEAAEGEIDGVAVWWGPGRVMFGCEQEQRIFADLRLKMSDATQRWWEEEFLPRQGRGDSITAKETQAGWYLAAIGVRPGVQSKGVGTALVQHGLSLATRDNVPATVEYTNPKNARFYEKQGFEVRGSATKQGPNRSWTTWYCVRDAPQ